MKRIQSPNDFFLSFSEEKDVSYVGVSKLNLNSLAQVLGILTIFEDSKNSRNAHSLAMSQCGPMPDFLSEFPWVLDSFNLNKSLINLHDSSR